MPKRTTKTSVASSTSERISVLRRPSATELAAARGALLPDVIARNLDALFVGINPSLYSAAVGHHFARPGNRFWAALHGAKLTPRRFAAYEDRQLLEVGLGLTNLVARATARADELDRDELLAGTTALAEKVERYAPRWVVVVGITAFRTGFERPRAQIGLQPERLGRARVWALPNPSGLNAHYQLHDLVTSYAEFRASWT